MISFGLTEEQQMIVEIARGIAQKELRPRLRAFEKAGDVSDELRHKVHELGLPFVDVPEDVGGQGQGALTAAMVHEELAAGDPGAAVAVWGPGFAAAALVELGTDEQRARLLAPFVAPDGALRRAAVAWSEPRPDGPVEGFATLARRDGDGWILDGKKSFVVHAGVAELTVVFAQIDAANGWDGAAAFAVEGPLAASRRSQWLGLETVIAGDLVLDGVRVPDANRLGFDVARVRRFFGRVQLATAARQVGLARAAYETTLAYTQDRQAFGKSIAHFQAVSFNLAEMHMDVEAARWMVWKAAAELDADAPTALASIAKAAITANESAWRVADDAVQLHGGAGFIQDFPVEKWMRDTATLAMFGGNDQLAQLIVAGVGSGLPEHGIQPVVT